MARITVEDCLENVSNRFALVHLSKERAKQILGGSRARLQSSNKAIVVSLREIAAGLVRFMSNEEAEIERALEEQARNSNSHDDLGLPPPKLVMDDPFGPDDLGPDEISVDDAGVEDLVEDVADESDDEEGEGLDAKADASKNGSSNGAHVPSEDTGEEF